MATHGDHALPASRAMPHTRPPAIPICCLLLSHVFLSMSHAQLNLTQGRRGAGLGPKAVSDTAECTLMRGMTRVSGWDERARRARQATQSKRSAPLSLASDVPSRGPAKHTPSWERCGAVPLKPPRLRWARGPRPIGDCSTVLSASVTRPSQLCGSLFILLAV